MLEPRWTQSGIAPDKSRKGPLAHPRVLLLASVAVLLGAYALGYMPEFGSLLEDAVQHNHSAEAPVLGPTVYGIAGLAAFLILLGGVKSADLLLRKLRKAPPLSTHPAKPVEQFIDRSGSGEVARQTPITSTAAPERRLSDSAQRKALHAATLLAIESGTLHTGQASGMHRRAADYNGPRRRVTDNRIDPEFNGPYRRATDRPSSKRSFIDGDPSARTATGRVAPASTERSPPFSPGSAR